jgi:CBS domain-containing protein
MQYKNEFWNSMARQSVSPDSARVLAKAEVVTATQETSLAEIVNLMRQHHIGDVVVVEKSGAGEKPIGIVTDRDILLKTFSHTGNHGDLEVADVMSPFLTVAKVDDDVFKMIGVMAEEGICRLPIVDHAGMLCGIVTAKKLLQHCIGGLNDLAGLSDQQRSNERVMKH